jgi:hypothetical protein
VKRIGVGAARAIAQVVACLGLGAVLIACVAPDQIEAGGPELPSDAGEDGEIAVDDSGVPIIGGRAGLTVTGVVPESGPFAGGNQVRVRGSGFSEEALVFFGGRMAQPADTVRIDRSTLSVVVPAGDVGVVDVTVREGDAEATRRDAYTYNPLLIAPTEGSIAGGTSIVITARGATFTPAVTVDVGGEPCIDVRVITPSSLRCKTPPGAVGLVDVVVHIEEEGDVPQLSAREAFEYLDFSDTLQGGLSGGPIDGSINVTVIDAFRGNVMPGVFVMVGDAVGTALRGVTNDRGQVTFSEEGLVGPVTIHAALECFERISIVAFDARNVTLELVAMLDPTCGDPGELMPGGGRGVAGSIISGELIFPGPDEFAPNTWDVLPEPRANEERVAYVYTTRGRIEAQNPSPELTDGIWRVTEGSPVGVRGFLYRIFARPAGLAVYAIAGLERRDTGELTPYLMGVTRDLVTAPGEELEAMDIQMTLPLDHKLEIEVAPVPERNQRGPSSLRVQAHLDLGGEGVIVREVGVRQPVELMDMQQSLTASSEFPFFAQPAILGTLDNARYEVLAGYYAGPSDQDAPFTRVRLPGVVQGQEPTRIADMLDIPRAVAPEQGARIPSDRTLRWEQPGEPADFFIITVQSGAEVFSWQQLVPGTQTESVLPDLSKIPEVGDVPEGLVLWTVQAVREPDFVFDELKLDQLNPRLFSHHAVDAFTMQR